jgi:hypothetical protein
VSNPDPIPPEEQDALAREKHDNGARVTVRPIPPEELAKLDALEAAATPGPWRTDSKERVGQNWLIALLGHGDRKDVSTDGVRASCLGDAGAEDDAALIVALRNAYPRLRAALRPKIKAEDL